MKRSLKKIFIVSDVTNLLSDSNKSRKGFLIEMPFGIKTYLITSLQSSFFGWSPGWNQQDLGKQMAVGSTFPTDDSHSKTLCWNRIPEIGFEPTVVILVEFIKWTWPLPIPIAKIRIEIRTFTWTIELLNSMITLSLYVMLVLRF